VIHVTNRHDDSPMARATAALVTVFDDPSIDEITADDLCGSYPAVRYHPPDGFGLDILTRLGEAFAYEDLDIEERVYEGVVVKVVTAIPLALVSVGVVTTVPPAPELVQATDSFSVATWLSY